jgi:PAS domain S-box-containing protein
MHSGIVEMSFTDSSNGEGLIPASPVIDRERMDLDQDKMQKIRSLLKFNPKGLSISEIATRLKLNRNSVAKYLELLSISGQVEMQSYGSAKVYYLSQRVPLSALLNFSSDLVLILDSDRKVIQVNEQILQFFGEKRENIVGKLINEIPPDIVSLLPVQEILTPQDSQTERTRELESHIRGESYYFREKFIPTVFDDGGEGLTIIMEDITKDKRYERDLEINEARYRGIVEDQTELICRNLPDGTLTFVNDSYCRYFGKSREQLIGTSFLPLIPEEQREKVLQQIRTLNKENPVMTHEHQVIHPVLGLRWQQWTNRVFFDEQGVAMEYQGTGRDVSDRRAAEELVASYAEEMKFLSQTAMSFVRIPDNEDIYLTIGGNMRPLLPEGAIVIIESFDRITNSVTIRAILDSGVITALREMLNRDPLGMVFPNDTRLIGELRADSFVRLSGGLSGDMCRVLSPQIPVELCRTLDARFGIGDAYIFGLISEQGDFFGHVIILCRKGTELENTGIISAYMSQASISVQKYSMESRLRKSEEQFRNVAELSPFPVSIIDVDNRYLYVNDSFTHTFGYTLDDISTGRDWFEKAFPDHDLARKAIITWHSDLARARPGEVRPRIFPVRCKSGEDKEVLFRPVKMSDGRHFILYEDITERQKAEKIRNLLAAIVLYSDDAIIGKQPDGTIISWNPAAERMFGYKAEEVTGRPVQIMIPAHLHADEQNILNRVRKGERIAHFETLRTRKDGRAFDVSVSISPIRDENGVVVGASSIVRDISVQKAEEKLKETEERYRSLVDNICVGVYRSTGDPQGRFVWGNSSLVEIFGCSSLEALQQVPVAELFLERDGRKELLDDLKQEGVVKNRVLHLKRCDGTPIRVRVTATAVFTQSGEIDVITGIVEDITERWEFEQDLSRAHASIQHIVDCIPDPSCVVGQDRNVVAWNSAMEALTGFPRTEIVGQPDIDKAFSRIGIARPLLHDLLDMPPDELNTQSPDYTLRRRVNPAGLALQGIIREEIEEKACLFRGPDGVCLGAMATISCRANPDENFQGSKKS